MDEKIVFRPLAESDFYLLHRWRGAEHIAPWFGPCPSSSELASYYREYIDGTAGKAGHVVMVDDQPIGFVESYRSEDQPTYFANMGVNEPSAVGMDVFIGERDALDRGLGTRIIRAFVERVLFAEEGASACIVAPDSRNPRSIRAFEKAGFIRVRTIQVPGDAAPALVLRHPGLHNQIGPEFNDGAIAIRPMTLQDVEAHLAGEDEPTVRWLSGGASTRETVTTWITRNRESWRSGGPVRCFGIRDTPGDLVGMVEANLNLQGVRAGVANISYGLYPNARRKGFATRAVLLICEYLRNNTTSDTAMIQVDLDNEVSAKVPVRAGFRFVGKRVTPDGTPLLTFVRSLQ